MRRAVVVYGAAIVAVLVALLCRQLLDPVLGGQLPLATVYGAVAAGVWLGGIGPALLAAFLGFAAGNFLFLDPRHSHPLDSAQDWIALIAFLSTCSIIIALGEALRGARRSAESRRRMIHVTLTSIGDAVITADQGGLVTLLNPAAEALTGWTHEGARGQPLRSVFHVVDETTRGRIEDTAERAIASDGPVSLGRAAILVAADGTERPMEGSAAPIRDSRGRAAGVVLVFRDASESRSVESALRREARLLEESHDAVFAWRLEGPILFWNRGAERLYGFSRREAEGRTRHDLLRTEYPGGSRAALEAALARESEFQGELVHARKGGGRVPVESRIQVMRDEGGAPFVLETSRDISQRKREQEALLESERRFRLMADGAPVMIWICDTAKLCTWCNQPWLDFTGRTLEQELGNGWHESVHPDDLAACTRSYSEAFDVRRPFSMEYRLRRRDGEFRWVMDRGAPLPGPGDEFTGYIGSCIDITERKEMEERLRRAEEAARAVVENVADGILTIDGAGVIQSFNAAAERMFGYAAREVIGSDVRTLMPDARYLETGLVQGIGSGREVEGLRRDGTTFPMDLAVSEFRLDRRRHFIGIVRDITERRILEQRLRERAEQLAKEERRKDEFLATLAHELRNPLAPIHNAVQVLMASGSEDPELRWCRDVIDRHVRHMARLLDDLLDVSRISHGKLELRKERVPLAAVVQSAVEASRPLIEGRRHALDVALPAEPVYLEADPVRLAQVFSNLLNNAARYTQAGGHIRLSAERNGTEVAVRVKDDGIGISADMMPHIFEIFSQAPEGLERSQGGLGVGLSLVRRLVQLHGGRVDATSGGRNRGSEFTVHLRAAARPLKRAVGRDVVEPAARRRLLIVDDMKDAADSLARLMRLKGHEVRAAYDGGAAIAAAAEFRPEVVLLDIGMPKLDGYETCRRIREQPWAKGMFLVALTGWGQEGDRRRAEEVGFNHHLVKPVDPLALAALLASLPVAQGARS